MPPDPELDVAASALVEEGARFVVVGGFAVIANRFVRATEDVTSAGLVDLLRGGEPPLDFETVAARAMPADYGGVEFLVASLASIVGFKRLADRPRDRNDLLGLAEVHGALPIEPIPGLDS